jgi:hypothetical protein
MTIDVILQRKTAFIETPELSQTGPERLRILAAHSRTWLESQPLSSKLAA